MKNHPSSDSYLPGAALLAVLLLAGCDGGSAPVIEEKLNETDPPPGDTTLNLGLERVYANRGFDQPLAMLQAPGDDTRWFVVEREGRVMTFPADPAAAGSTTEFIDINGAVDSSGEGGLLGMAFHPDYAVNGQVFLSYTRAGSPLVSVVSRFTTIAGGTALDPFSEEEILIVNQEFANHNGGHIAFGPDGYLYMYIGLGDGGGAGDPNNRAQDPTNLLGALLRLDVNNPAPGAGYGIPVNNPFAGNALCTPDPNLSVDPCPEIYAWGLRNPWRWSFDRQTGDLWLADVGQNAWEEINLIRAGGNYGWNVREGAHCFGQVSCPTAGLIDPVAEYGRGLGTSVTGGYAYRGAAIPGLAGQYLFGDYGSGRVWRLVEDPPGVFTMVDVLDTALNIVSFAQDAAGELYVIDIAGGGLYRIVNTGTP